MSNRNRFAQLLVGVAGIAIGGVIYLESANALSGKFRPETFSASAPDTIPQRISSRSINFTDTIQRFARSNGTVEFIPLTGRPIQLQARNDFVCPSDLESLTNEMLEDLPSYANRVNTRSRVGGSQLGGYVLIAGRPDFEPLALGPGEWTSPAGIEASDLKQVFMTTLERQYTAGKRFSLQQYHWLFMAETPRGWRLAMMFSRTAIKPSKRPPTPPRDSSDGIVAQAVRLWLEDCYNGSIRRGPLR